MALRGKKPTEIKKRLKALFYGVAGAGKTTTAIQFPAPYLIDTEKGAENDSYVKLINERGGAILQTNIFEELIEEVKSLLTEKHSYKTLIIDPLTTIYNDLLDSSAKKLANPREGKDGTEFGRHYGEANKQMRQLMNLLIRLDMNVIITSHAKNEYGQNLSVLSQTFDCYKKLDYLFDVVFEIKKIGKDRNATVKKTRIYGFPDGDIFPFSYQEIAKRYDSGILEKESMPEVLAKEDQVNEIKRLIELLKIPEDIIDKWLAKSGATKFDEMTEKNILACIEWARKQIEPIK